MKRDDGATTAGPVRLGEVQETLLATLYARAVESTKKRGLLRDPKAVEMVDSIDYDFAKFDGAPTLIASVARTLIMDHWVRSFAGAHGGGTVIEIGAGLNSRFERVGDARTHWIDLDLPDSMRLRRKFFAESDRRRMIEGSFLDDSWPDVVKGSPGPYFFVAEGVLPYFEPAQARRAIERVTARFPGARLAFDTTAGELVAGQDHPALKKRVAASFKWACDRPREIERWAPGMRLVESRTLLDLPPEVRARLAPAHRLMLPVIRPLFRRRAAVFRVNLFTC